MIWRRRASSEPDGQLPANRKRGKSTAEATGPDQPGRRPTRARHLALSALKMFLAGAATGLTMWAGISAHRHVTSTEYFAVHSFEVVGGRRLSDEEIIAAADLSPGTNIFRIDSVRAAGLVRQHPWVADAEVQRRLPRQVMLQITERDAAAIVVFDVPYLVDESGEVFKRWAAGDPVPAPLITGFEREQFARDRARVTARIRDALSLAGRHRAAGLRRIAPLHEIHVELDGGFSLTMGDDPFYVYFGHGPYRKKLQRLATLLRRMRKEGSRPATIFFDNEIRPDRVTVRLKRPEDDETNTRDPALLPSDQKTLSKI